MWFLVAGFVAAVAFIWWMSGDDGDGPSWLFDPDEEDPD